jgi:hypothetical protein
MINENYSKSNTITISDKSTQNNAFGLDTTVVSSHKPQRGSSPKNENGDNDNEDKLTTSYYEKLIMDTGMSRGNIKSSVDKSNKMVTTMKIKDTEQTMLNSTTSSENTWKNALSLPNNETNSVDNIMSTIFENSIKYGNEIKSMKTYNVDINNNELTSKINNSMLEYIMKRKTTKPIENSRMTDIEIKVTNPVNENMMTQKEQSSSNKETIEDPPRGTTEKAGTINTEYSDSVTRTSQTWDSRLTSSEENIVTSKQFSEHSSISKIVFINNSLNAQDSSNKKEFSKTSELTKKLIRTDQTINNTRS